MTEFQRNVKDYVGRLKKKKAPLVLTVNGRAELVVQDAESYQELLDRLEQAEAMAAIRQGAAQAREGQALPLSEVEQKLRKKHAFSR